MSRFGRDRIVPWLGLAAILVGYVTFIVRLHPANLFGIAQDDTIYFSSAKAIAEGKGYVLPNLPGTPSASKYPILYPWMLSWIWRWGPSFPENVKYAVALTVASGVIFLVLVFVFFRKMGLGYFEALLLTSFCAFNPVVLFYSALVFSDIPFAALCLGSLLLADSSTKRDATNSGTVSCGILAGFSMLMRTLGYPIVLGIFVTAVLRKSWRQAATLTLTIGPFLVFILWRNALATARALPANWAVLGSGFRQTWIYYTDYLGFRKLSVLDIHHAAIVPLNQVLYFCTELPGYFLSPFFRRSIPLLFILTVLLLWLIFDGLGRLFKLGGFKPIYSSLFFYCGAVLTWDFPEWQRFLIPFLPLFTLSLWSEGKWIFGQLLRAVRTGGSLWCRLASVSLSAGMAALGLGIVWNSLTSADRRALPVFSEDRAHLLAEKRQAYDWLKQNSLAGSAIVAGEDGCVYLYTGRPSMDFIATIPIGNFDSKQLQSDLDHITDVARAIDATYWLASPDDSDKGSKAEKPLLGARLGEVEAALPEVFRSSSGNVRIYGTACLQTPQDVSCRKVAQILFPDGVSGVALTSPKDIEGNAAMSTKGNASEPSVEMLRDSQ